MPNLSFFKMQGTLIEVVDKWCREHLPTKVSELENDAGYLTEATIPGANDGVLTIKRNDSSIGTFSANQSTNESINIAVPTAANEISYGNVTVEEGLNNVSNRKNLKAIDVTDTSPVAITSGSGYIVNYQNIVSAYAFTPYDSTVQIYRHDNGGMYARVIDVNTKQEVTGTCQLIVFYWT